MANRKAKIGFIHHLLSPTQELTIP